MYIHHHTQTPDHLDGDLKVLGKGICYMHGAFEGGKSKFLLCQHGIPLLTSCTRTCDHHQGEKERVCHGVCVRER